MKRIFLMSAALIVSCLLAACVYAEVPHMIRFQGKVTNAEGAPLSGAYNITFRIYDDETSGTLMWSETQTEIPVNNGIFTVLLGNTTPTGLDLPFDQSYWLSMEVNDDGEMSPRQRITSVGYAIHAETAERFVEESVVPQGAIILWRGTSCPEGYNRVTEMDGKFLVSGSSYNPAAGGSNTHKHGPGTYRGPAHTHTMSHKHSAVPGGGDTFCTGCGGGVSEPTVSNTGASGADLITGESALADNRPEFATVILCEKD